MLKLAVFNSIKYSFNMKTWVSDRAIPHLAPSKFMLGNHIKDDKKLVYTGCRKGS